MEILRERPEDMSFIDYKIHLKVQKKWIRTHKRGLLYYLANETIFSPEDKLQMFGIKKTYLPFVGKTKELTEPI